MTTTQDLLTIQVGTINASVQKSGTGDPLVYLHGAFGYKGWPDFLDILARSHTVYAPLHPGFLDAEGIGEIDDLLGLALYHQDLFDALELERPHVVGQYFGAMIAAEMSAICSHRTGKLALAAPAGLWQDDNPGVDYNATPHIESRDILFANPDSEIALSVLPDTDSDEERGLQIIERVQALSTVGKFLWPIPEKGLRKRARRIENDTLIVVGDEDKIVPSSYGDLLASEIPNSSVHVMQNAGHLFNIEQPEEFARVVSEFLG